MQKKIEITISPIGESKIEAIGFQGCGCTQATEPLEIVLGGGVKKKTPKPEMYAPSTTAESTKLVF